MSFQKSLQDVQESIKDVHTNIQDGIASKAVRKNTLRSLKQKKKSHLKFIKKEYDKTVQEINIQYAKDPERLKAKYAAADYARTEKARRKAERKIANEQKAIELSLKERRLTTGEEIGSAIVQGIGVALFIAATAILDTLGIKDGMALKSFTIVMYSLFGSSMILMLLFSCLQHALLNYISKEVFRRLSRVLVFLVIGFAVTTYTVTKIHNVQGWVYFSITWVLVIIGALLYAITGNTFKKAIAALYIVSGFSGMLLIRSLFISLSGISFSMLMCAAGFYMIGLIFYYGLKKVLFLHFVGNVLMLVGSVFLFFSLFFIN